MVASFTLIGALTRFIVAPAPPSMTSNRPVASVSVRRIVIREPGIGAGDLEGGVVGGAECSAVAVAAGSEVERLEPAGRRRTLDHSLVHKRPGDLTGASNGVTGLLDQTVEGAGVTWASPTRVKALRSMTPLPESTNPVLRRSIRRRTAGSSSIGRVGIDRRCRRCCPGPHRRSSGCGFRGATTYPGSPRR